MYSYYNVVDSGKTFQEAYDLFKSGKYVRRKHFSTVYGPCCENMDTEKFSIAEFASTDWEVLEVNWALEDKLAEVRDYVEDADLYLDTRFYDIDKMCIGEIFDRICDAISEETIYKLIMYLKSIGVKFKKYQRV